MGITSAQKYLDSLIKGLQTRIDEGAPFGWKDPDSEECYSEKTDAPDAAELEPAGAYDYLTDALEVVDFTSGGEYRGARVCIAFGGPNTYIEIWGGSGEMQVAWWSATLRADLPREFTGPLFDALEEIHSMR